jgi:hypothetical protein
MKFNRVLGLGPFKTADAGAATTIVAALDPELGALRGMSIVVICHAILLISNNSSFFLPM